MSNTHLHTQRTALLGMAVLVLSLGSALGCGIVDAVEYRPEPTAEAVTTSVAWQDLPAAITRMITEGEAGDTEKTTRIREQAIAIESSLMASPEAKDAPDRVQKLRTRVLAYAAGYPEDRVKNAERLKDALGELGFAVRPESSPAGR